MTVGVAVLGSTGSIGTAALRVLARQRERFRVVALTANDSADLLKQQVTATGARSGGLVRGGAGPECLVEAATHPEVRIVINAVVARRDFPPHWPRCGRGSGWRSPTRRPW